MPDSIKKQKNSRRKFFKVCGSLAGTLLAGQAAVSTTQASISSRHYDRVKLILNKSAVRPDELPVGQAFIFNYPYVTTPCILVNLGKSALQRTNLAMENGTRYNWSGGSGKAKTVVAYSAICAHRMTYPAKSASFINYRHSKVVFFDKNKQRQEMSQTIYCCSERSVYDPLHGAQVIGGPAPQPLASILLDYDDNQNELYAVGTAGGEMFDLFFEKFAFRLQLDFEITDVKKRTTGQVAIVPIEEYSETIVRC